MCFAKGVPVFVLLVLFHYDFFVFINSKKCILLINIDCKQVLFCNLLIVTEKMWN